MNYWFLYNYTTGTITQPYLGNADQWTNIPSGQGVIGPFSQASATAAVQDAYTNPQLYTVQSGQLVQAANYTSLQLQQAQNAKIGDLNSKCNQTILSGFASSALSVSHNYDFDYEAQMNFSGMMNAVNASIAPASITWKTTDAGNLAHTQAQFKQLYADGMNFKNTQITKYWNLKAQVLAATTVSQVNTITW